MAIGESFKDCQDREANNHGKNIRFVPLPKCDAECSAAKKGIDQVGEHVQPPAHALLLGSFLKLVEFLPGLGVGRAGGGELFVESFVRIDFRTENSPLHNAEV
ncbi:MAG TPA: hypothetical protein VGS15_07555 [Candidatus Acidoferrales bacterium]|nr:hypothetical protein [Candidatus Acidoferrales bacterium]